ncbi:PREDICTED: retinal homeobox protein Rx1-like isoform X1 [Acropora digitifera]|uniref:retinal homeobox protein Rx1-like isoform X1 n=1 Tax=Acropora digitifera TaxID=70779 RepID=UPI00077A5B1C|nr:PREDICTED: retinal homeobox protein Rx1-like isoform X1 [Acropora digitifera]
MTPSKAEKRPAPASEPDNSMRKRRRRTAFTDEQLDRLEEAFENEKFPGIQIREDLSRELNIKEDRIQVWFQNRRARWRKREIKNKPAPGLAMSETRPPSHDVISPTMFQPSPAIYPPLNSVPFRPWEPFFAPFPTNSVFLPGVPSLMYHSNTTSSSPTTHTTQTVDAMVGARVTASARRLPSPTASLETLYQASCYDSDSGGSQLSADDYLAAVTLASGFQREN